ncbi:MAG: radical SAM protein, partial [Candidatus Hydrothermarchaeota archaeon]
MGEERPATYSRNVFIPLTNACRNRCGYCAFRSEKPGLMGRSEVLNLLRKGARHGCKEALFTMGERPEVHPEIRRELRAMGYATVIEYLYDLCLEAKDLGLLPHTNAGVVGGEELRALGEVNASLGLMLESVSERLCEPGMPHEGCP